MIFKNLFSSSKDTENTVPLEVDIHSHLLPGLDDGVETFEDAIEVIQSLQALGFKKFITTPHVMGDFFKNTVEDILAKKEELVALLKTKNIDVEIEAAAEYYLDEWFIEKIAKNEPLLTFGNKYVLLETSYMNEPAQLHQVIFDLNIRGYKPVLAHPERYTYMYDDFKKYEDLLSKSVYFQVNTISLSGYYSKKTKQVADKLVAKGMVHFLGSDCHGKRHVIAMARTLKEKTYQKALQLDLINRTL